MSKKEEVYTSASDLNILQEKGYSLGKLIGKGSYAKVFKGTQILDETRHCVLACKVIDTSKAPREYLTKFLPREMDVLIRLNHPHIIHISSVFQRRAKYFIFLRFAENGDLLDFLTTNGAIAETQSRLWMRQILLAIEYMHTLNIAHRDLKCENVLITANFNVKITDFGFARYVKQREKDILSETYCGSLSYAAPEVLRAIPYYPKVSDMWSVGVIMYTMLNKALPFSDTSVKKLYEKQMMRKWKFRSTVVNNLSNQCKQLVTELLEPDGAARPSASGIIAGPWLQMDPKLAKMTFLEESLLQRAKEESKKRMTTNEDNESERLVELRRKQRSKNGLKILKATDINDMKSAQLFKEETDK